MAALSSLFDIVLFLFSLAIIHNFFRPKQKPPPGLRPNCLITRHPIVFIHGLKNFFIIKDYFNSIPRYLADHGYKCFEPRFVWRGPATRRKLQIKNHIEAILKKTSSQKIHLIAHSLGAIDCLELCLEEKDFAQKVASLTLVSAPLEGSPYSVLAKYFPFTGDLKNRLDHAYRMKCLITAKELQTLPLTGVVVGKGSPPFSGSPGLFVQKYLWRLLRFSRPAESFDGFVTRESQIGSFQIFWEFDGDHFQAIGSGIWPKGKKTAHEHFLDHAIFLAERDLIG